MIYKVLDKNIPKLKNHSIAMFEPLSFDEVNILKAKEQTKNIYDNLLSYNLILLSNVAIYAYKDSVVLAEDKGFKGKPKPPKEDFVYDYLLEYNPITQYLYFKETERKRLRLVEQLLTAKEYKDYSMLANIKKNNSTMWCNQSIQYGIGIADNAQIKAYKDYGVTLVEWDATLDSRVCNVCKERHGKVYEIDKVPPKPHRGCRCTLIPRR